MKGGTREQIQMLFFNDLITAESHYLTTDSDIMQRREIPSAYNLMLLFPQACIFFYLMSDRQYWITECICEWDQLEETEWNPQNPMYFAGDLSKFPDISNEWGPPHSSPSQVDTRMVHILNEAKHLFDEYQEHIKTHFALDDQGQEWIKRRADQDPELLTRPHPSKRAAPANKPNSNVPAPWTSFELGQTTSSAAAAAEDPDEPDDTSRGEPLA